jgi:hypothetical protein
VGVRRYEVVEGSSNKHEGEPFTTSWNRRGAVGQGATSQLLEHEAFRGKKEPDHFDGDEPSRSTTIAE